MVAISWISHACHQVIMKSREMLLKVESKIKLLFLR